LAITMMPLEKQALRDAVEKRRKDELFESSLARQIKNLGLSYEDYIVIISDLRDFAKGEEIELEEAARRLYS
jgi:hypothetical protein